QVHAVAATRKWGRAEVGRCAVEAFWGVILLWDQLCARASAGAGAGAAQKEGSLGWTSGGDQGGSNGADGPVSCRSQGAGPAQLAPKPLWVLHCTAFSGGLTKGGTVLGDWPCLYCAAVFRCAADNTAALAYNIHIELHIH
ncbi:hypothetical protein LB507_010446, partial [Fusarium sp. FIESC RH6]